MSRTPKTRASQDGSGKSVAEVPHCLYLYHLTPGEGPHPTIRAYVHQSTGPIRNIETVIRNVTRRARDGKLQPSGWAMGDLRWRRKSYIAAVLDDPGNMFASKDGLIIEPNEGSFKDKKLIPIEVDGAMLQAIYCRNIVKKKENDWPNEPDYEPDFYRIRLVLSGKDGPRNHEDTGQNLGPPVPPP